MAQETSESRTLDQFMTARDAGRVMGVTKRRVLQLIALGELPATKRGGIWLIEDVDVIDFSRKQRVPGRPRRE